MVDASTPTSGPRRRMSDPEFIALMAMLFATIAFSIDATLPAIPEMTAALAPDRPQAVAFVVIGFVFGMGLGTLFVGPLSDAFGRRALIFSGAGLYITGALLGWMAQSVEVLVAARVLQGLGAAGPRIAALAMIRDLYVGRQMARIMSFSFFVFTIFPAIAPLIGATIVTEFGWRGIFLAFVLFSGVSITWLWARQPETLPPESRRPLSWATLWDGTRQALGHRQVQLSILVQSMIFGILFGMISSVQQIFDQVYDRGAAFPLLFGLVSILASPSAIVNGTLVVRIGMRPLIRRALWAGAAVSALYVGVAVFELAPPEWRFWVFYGWLVVNLAVMGFTLGNLNALALEPMGHVAGLAASLMGCLATVSGALIAGGIALAFSGTALPLIGTAMVLATAGALIMRHMPREKV